MQLFYSDQINGDKILLTGDEYRHCVKSLRKVVGDQIFVANGKGRKFTCQIRAMSKNSCALDILETEVFEPIEPKLTLAIAPTKNISRFEFFLEKATEIGVHKIIPMFTQFSERKKLRLDRCQRVLISAMKQCLQFHIPIIEEPLLLKDVLACSRRGQRLIAYVDERKTHLKEVYHKGQDALILIGPEGGFSVEEHERATKSGFISTSLGKHRLRAETAGIVATSFFASKNA